MQSNKDVKVPIYIQCMYTVSMQAGVYGERQLMYVQKEPYFRLLLLLVNIHSMTRPDVKRMKQYTLPEADSTIRFDSFF